MPSVNPQILQWARETAGMSVESAADRLSLKDTRRISGADKLRALENGASEPDRNILTRMAKTYRRPLISFYLRQPPPPDKTGQDFRTVPQRTTTDEPLVNALVRDIKARQSLVKSVLEDEDAQILPFVGAGNTHLAAHEILNLITAHIEIELPKFRAARTPELGFSYLRRAFEDAGIFVLLAGNLGTHHTNIDVAAFRGICIADPLAPFIVINDQDAKSAWSFTLLHEAAHLCMGESAISSLGSDFESEQICNEVASQFLLPPGEIDQMVQFAGSTDEELLSKASQFALERNISVSLVIYRLHRIEAIAAPRWEGLAEHLRSEWRKSQDRDRELRKAKGKDTGPNPYVVKAHRLGKSLLRLVDRGVAEGSLTPTKASKVLGISPRGVQTLLNTAKGKAAQ